MKPYNEPFLEKEIQELRDELVAFLGTISKNMGEGNDTQVLLYLETFQSHFQQYQEKVIELNKLKAEHQLKQIKREEKKRCVIE